MPQVRNRAAVEPIHSRALRRARVAPQAKALWAPMPKSAVHVLRDQLQCLVAFVWGLAQRALTQEERAAPVPFARRTPIRTLAHSAAPLAPRDLPLPLAVQVAPPQPGFIQTTAQLQRVRRVIIAWAGPAPLKHAQPTTHRQLAAARRVNAG